MPFSTLCLGSQKRSIYTYLFIIMVQKPFKSSPDEDQPSKFVGQQSSDLSYTTYINALSPDQKQPLPLRRTFKSPLSEKIEPIDENLQRSRLGRLIHWWQGINVKTKATSLAVAMSTIPVLAIG